MKKFIYNNMLNFPANHSLWGVQEYLVLVMAFIVVLQLFVVGASTLMITHRLKTKPKRMSERQDVGHALGFFHRMCRVVKNLIVNNTEKMFVFVIIADVILWVASILLPAATVKLGTTPIQGLYLAVLSLVLHLYMKVASWQLESELLYYFRNIDDKWAQPGNIHKIYILEALPLIEQTALTVATRLCDEGEDHIYDTPSEALDIKEDYVKKMAIIQHDISKNSLILDKEPSCCERIAEDLFLLIAEGTMKSLAKSVVSMQKNHMPSTLWFPTAYGSLVWRSSLDLAKELKVTPSATSLISFKEFHSYFDAATFSHPNSNARRLFLVDTQRYHWREELKTELLAIGEKDGRATRELPQSYTGAEKITYLEWVKQAHDDIGWDVKFLNLSEAKNVREKCNSEGELPRYMDFLLVPTATEWKVLFSCDPSVNNTRNDYGLPLQCCPLTLRYIKDDRCEIFFNLLWQKAKPAHEWLSCEITDMATLNLETYKIMVQRLQN